jgi:glycosyltransferase involved in cell wall biosynthesis
MFQSHGKIFSMNCSVVIPVYRGEQTIEPLVNRLANVLPACAEKFEVLLVNDGSPDHSWDVIESLIQKYSWVCGINLMRNYGQDNALLCGIREACHELIITMDDDLQHDPEDIPKLIAKLREGYDVVYGVPRVRRQVWWKSILSTIVKWAISSVMGVSTVRDIGSYRVFRAELKQAFSSVNSLDVQVDVLLSWTATRFTSVEIEEAPRTVGTSNYSFMKLIKISLLILTNYTTIPLRVASILGFLFTIIGIFVLLYVVITYFALGSIPGFSFLVSVVTIFSGVQLFALGIIGEYLARMFERSSGRPPYVIQRKAGGNS